MKTKLQCFTCTVNTLNWHSDKTNVLKRNDGARLSDPSLRTILHNSDFYSTNYEANYHCSKIFSVKTIRFIPCDLWISYSGVCKEWADNRIRMERRFSFFEVISLTTNNRRHTNDLLLNDESVFLYSTEYYVISWWCWICRPFLLEGMCIFLHMTELQFVHLLQIYISFTVIGLFLACNITYSLKVCSFLVMLCLLFEYTCYSERINTLYYTVPWNVYVQAGYIQECPLSSLVDMVAYIFNLMKF